MLNNVFRSSLNLNTSEEDHQLDPLKLRPRECVPHLELEPMAMYLVIEIWIDPASKDTICVELNRWKAVSFIGRGIHVLNNEVTPPVYRRDNTLQNITLAKQTGDNTMGQTLEIVYNESKPFQYETTGIDRVLRIFKDEDLAACMQCYSVTKDYINISRFGLMSDLWKILKNV